MRLQSRRDFLKSLALGAAAVTLPGCGLHASTAPGSKKPANILLIMIDDLGWMDLRCQGNERLDTPNIDRLASQGMRFTDFYAAAPVCSPTRAAIMTGLAPARLALTNHAPDRPSFAPKNAKLLSAETLDYLPLKHVTIAERLKEAGYATGFFGKWHLSARKKSPRGPNEADLRPEYQGFDVNIGGCSFGGPPTYFDPYRIPNITPRRKGEYLPDRLADEAIKFIKAQSGRPFFVALWNYTVHWPMEAPQHLIEKYEKRLGPGLKDARYGAMIEAMDASIGRILTALDDLTRERLSEEVLQLWQRFRPTVLWVTHSVQEAVRVANRVLVMTPRPGTLSAQHSILLPRPRDDTTPPFQELVQSIRSDLAVKR